jgi:[acyl-carrier-protein] S-malonyltransferase
MSKKIAVVFPGQGSQYDGMGKDLYENFPEARQVFDQAASILGWDVRAVCFGLDKGKINLTEYTQPAILVSSIAAWEVFHRHAPGLVPSMVAGHSLGEYSALVASDGVDFSDALRLVQRRGKFMQESMPEGEGMMAASLGLDHQTVEAVCREASRSGVVSPANYNSPGQIVIAGVKAAVEEAGNLAKQRGAKRVLPLQVSVPSHCALMGPAAERLLPFLNETSFRPLRAPLVSNVDARPINQGDEVRGSLMRQLTQPVRWDAGVSYMMDSGCVCFVEVGPGRVLSGLVKRIAQDKGQPVEIFNVEDTSTLEKTVAGVQG